MVWRTRKAVKMPLGSGSCKLTLLRNIAGTAVTIHDRPILEYARNVTAANTLTQMLQQLHFSVMGAQAKSTNVGNWPGTLSRAFAVGA